MWRLKTAYTVTMLRTVDEFLLYASSFAVLVAEWANLMHSVE